VAHVALKAFEHAHHLLGWLTISALENALERVEYRRELLAGLDAVQAKWAPGTTRPT
jgi:hypothetical protein